MGAVPQTDEGIDCNGGFDGYRTTARPRLPRRRGPRTAAGKARVKA